MLIQETRTFEVAKDSFINSQGKTQKKMRLAASAAIRLILRLEPQLQNPLTNIPLLLSIQKDSRGIDGDVRDVLCIRRQNNWELGLSCKHNHYAVKHNRLSPSINFGKQWFGRPCSENYFTSITPLFNKLKTMRNKGFFWRDIDNKEEKFYIPLLKAFVNELTKLDAKNPKEIPRRLLRYLLGSNDFYKIIADTQKKVTHIQAFNLDGTLNRKAGTVRPETRIQQLKMPSRFLDIRFKPNSGTTILVACNQGWGISLRIHSAKSKVEPSLKFDVKLTGIPVTLYTHHELW